MQLIIASGITVCNRGGNNFIPTEATRQKMSDNHADFKGEKGPGYGVHRYGKDAPFFGHNHTEKSIALIIKNMPDMKGEKSPTWGRHHTEEDKIKMKEKQPDRSGKNGSTYNHTVYEWIHPTFGEISCIRGDLCLNYDLNNDLLKHVITGRYKQYKGWELKNSPFKPHETSKNKPKYDTNIYNWINVDGREENLTITQMSKKFDLCTWRLKRITLGIGKSIKGWIVKIF